MIEFLKAEFWILVGFLSIAALFWVFVTLLIRYAGRSLRSKEAWERRQKEINQEVDEIASPITTNARPPEL